MNISPNNLMNSSIMAVSGRFVNGDFRREPNLVGPHKKTASGPVVLTELRTYKARLTHELEVLTQKRKYLYNHKEVLTPDVRNRRLEELSARMRTVRRELNTCTTGRLVQRSGLILI